MTSPARAHFQRVAAAEAHASAVSGQLLENCTQYELMLLKLAEDRRRLKTIQSMEGKADVKKQLLPDYVPWVEGVLSAGKGAQDDVLMTVMLWRIDAGDYAGALDIAVYALPHKLTMPDRYQRTTACTLTEEIADAAKRARDGQQVFDITSLQRCLELTDTEDMPDQVRAKLHKELGLGLAMHDGIQDIQATPPVVETVKQALWHLQRATQLHDKVGVKKDIEKLSRELRDLGVATDTGDA